VVFEFNLLGWAVNTSSIQYVTYSWRNTFIVHVFSLTNVEFLLFIKSQFTKNAGNVLRLNQRTHGHSRSWNVAPFKSARAAVNGLTGTKMRLWSGCSFSVESEYTRGFECPTDKHLRLEVYTFLGRVQKSNVGRHTLIWTISIVVVPGNRVSSSSVLDEPCIPLRIAVYSLYYEVNFIWFDMLKFKIFNYITFVVSFTPNRHIFAAIYCVHVLPITLHSRTL